MAAAGFTPISLYYTTTSGAGGIPSAGNLVNGELAINITDGKLYYKDNGGTVQVIATKATGTIGGSTTQVQYNNAGVLAGSSNLTFDGTSLTLGGNPTLSAGTANGVLYLNGSKVATSGSALVFDGTNLGVGTASPVAKLDVNGAGVVRGFLTTTDAIKLGSNTSAPASTDAFIYRPADNTLAFGTASAEKMRLDSSGNLGLGGSAARATTAGSAIFNIFNGTAPVGTLTNGISLYSSSGEAYVMDAAGNATLFSPHDRDTNEWIFRSKHTPSGKVLKIDVERLLRFVNDHFGLDAVQEFIEP